MARLTEGSAAGLSEGLCWASAFLFRTGGEVGVCLGLVSVDAYSLSRTGESCGTTGVSGVLVGDPSNEDRIFSITRGPCLVALLLINP